MNIYPFVNVNYDHILNEEEDKTLLQLEITIRYDSLFQKNESGMPSVCLRVGTSRLYYVFDFQKFFHTLDGKDDYTFSPNFTMSLSEHTFSPLDTHIIHLLKELYELDGIFSKQRFPTSYNSDGIIEEKWIYLPTFYLEKLYRLLEKKSFRIEIPINRTIETIYTEGIQKDPETYAFDLGFASNGYELTYDFSIMKLTHSLHYVLLNGYVTKLTEETVHSLKPIFTGLLGQQTIFISQNKQEHFISQVVPYLKQLGTLHLDDTLAASIIEAPLHAEIYLDKKQQQIFATMVFNYDSYAINPFQYDPIDSQTIIFRDQSKEDLILSCFSDFVIRQDGLYLEDEDKSYDFLTESLPLLYEHSDVFYTDAFKSIQINPEPMINSRISYALGENFLDFSFDIESVNKDELHQLFNALQLKKKYYRLQNGSYIGINHPDIQQFGQMIDHLQLNYSDLTKDRIRLPAYRGFMIDAFSRKGQHFKLKRKESFKRLIESINGLDDEELMPPDCLKPVLRAYQLVGFKWLKTLSHFGFGGILADDMGLGKTLQTLAFIVSEYERSKQPTLIVAPSSLVYNWSEEITKFLPDLRVLIVDGLPKIREQLIQTCFDYPIVITSYPLLRRDITLYEAVHFNYCIIDEAQHIKNPKSQTAISVKRITADGYFALTGTPIENHLTELWSIFDFVMPQLLYSHNKFIKLFETPIMKEEDQQALQRLKTIIRPFILRRLKSEVLKELPEKIESKIVAKLNSSQKKLYLAYLEQAKTQVRTEILNKTFKKNHLQILQMITRLRQICCHPSMFIEDYKGSSGKLDLLMELIEDSIESDHRMLIFSQYTSMLGIIRKELDSIDIPYAYLDGKVPSRKRKDIIHSFNHGDLPIFLISLKAGGTGLNLTTADVVVHFDPWWNPAVEDQATDRAYRIGQNKNVQVFKLIAKGTIEEKIYELQQKKKTLAESVVESGDTLLTSMSTDDIQDILDL